MKNKILRNFLIGISFSILVIFNGCQKNEGPVQTNPTDNNQITTTNSETVQMFKSSAGGQQYVEGEVLVKFVDGTTEVLRKSIRDKIKSTFKEKIHTRAMKDKGDNEGIDLLSTSMSVPEAINSIKKMSGVVYAEPNYIYTYDATSNDPYYTNGSLWGMYGGLTSPANQYGSRAGEAWLLGHTGSKNVIVGVIDEGIMTTHEDLAANIWVNPYEIPNNGIDDDGNGYIDDVNGWDFVNNDKTVYHTNQDEHGTHVAGTIGAVGGNKKGVAGVCWNVTIISCKFLGNNGGTTANAIKAIDYITDLKTKHNLNIVALNNSWGGGGFSQALQDAIERANKANILFIAAAGNSASNNDAVASYPSNYPNDNVIAVASINSTGKLSTFSNYGAAKVDLGAPGENIYSTLPGKKGAFTYGSYSGTSMATPHVTGAAALYASTHPGLTAAQIKAAILNSVISTPSLTGKCLTGGRLNVSGF
jgi:subtilisin family serine protease